MGSPIVPELEEEFERALSKREKKWKRIGFPPHLIDKAGERAERWLDGLVGIWDHTRKPELAVMWQRENIPAALEHSERWMIEITEAFAPEKAEKLRRKLEEVV